MCLLSIILADLLQQGKIYETVFGTVFGIASMPYSAK